MSIYDKASLVQIPSGVKSGTLYNVVPNTADGDFDFTRGSTATRVNKDGLIETVASGVPRLDYPLLDGVVQDCPALLLEPVRANKNTYSEDIESFTQFTNVTATNNQTTSPDGSVNAALVTADAVNNKHEFQNTNISFTSGTFYTVSVFVKANGYDYFAIKFASTNGVFGDDYAWFNASNGTTGTVDADIDGTSIENYGNGWYRISATQQANATASGKIFLAIGNADNTPTFLGDGSSGLYVWGYQIEDNAGYVSSYIPTSGSEVTRSADVCNGAQADFNDSEGVLFADLKIIQGNTESSRISISDGTASNRIMFEDDEIDNRLRAFSQAGGTIKEILNITDASICKQYFKLAIKWNGSNSSVYINGYEKANTSGLGDMTGLDTLSFESASGGLNFYGNSKQVMTFNEALSDTELENLTSWDSFREMATEQLYTIE